jgi:16S rRNA processing protein RimM
MLRSALPAPGPGEFYYDDMPGVPVRLPDGTEVGTVTYAFRGATDILAMNVDGREVLVPCVAGFVVSVGSDVVVIEPLALEEPL